MPCDRRQSAILGILDESGQQANIVGAVRGNDAELGQVTANGIDNLRPLADQHLPDAVDHEHLLLLLLLDRDESHGRPRHGFTDRFRIRSIVLVGLDEGADKLCR